MDVSLPSLKIRRNLEHLEKFIIREVRSQPQVTRIADNFSPIAQMANSFLISKRREELRSGNTPFTMRLGGTQRLRDNGEKIKIAGCQKS